MWNTNLMHDKKKTQNNSMWSKIRVKEGRGMRYGRAISSAPLTPETGYSHKSWISVFPLCRARQGGNVFQSAAPLPVRERPTDSAASQSWCYCTTCRLTTTPDVRMFARILCAPHVGCELVEIMLTFGSCCFFFFCKVQFMVKKRWIQREIKMSWR